MPPTYIFFSRQRSFTVLSSNRLLSDKKQETDAEFDLRQIAYLKRDDIDGWEIRKAMTDLHGEDLVPEPAIIIEALRGKMRHFCSV